jgi:hypothetical protein
MSHRAGLDAMTKKAIPSLYLESNPGRAVSNLASELSRIFLKCSLYELSLKGKGKVVPVL